MDAFKEAFMEMIVPVRVNVVVGSGVPYECYGVPHNHALLEQLGSMAIVSGGMLRQADIDSAGGVMPFTLNTEDGKYVPLAELLPQNMLREMCKASGGYANLKCNLNLSVPATEEAAALAKRLSLSYPKNPAGF